MLKGVLAVIAAVSLFAVIDAVGKLLSEHLSVLQIVWARYAFALPLLPLAVPLRAWTGLLRVRRPWLQAGRALLPMLASFSVVLGLALMPLAEVTALTFAAPFLVVALSAPLLREPVSIHDWAGVALGFLGILVIVRPGAGAFAWAALFPLGCAFFFALFQITTRIVGRDDDPGLTLAWTIGVGLAATTPLLPLDWRPASALDWALMAVSGLAFVGSQYLLIKAFAAAPAAVLTPFTYSQIAPAVLLGLLLFGAVPDLPAVLGTAIVIAAGLYILHRRLATSAR
jgi:drug/metabolite transporter (DMT)-like permease